jgi:hypothetical protein
MASIKTKNDAILLTKKAIDNNELSKLLCGDGDYSIPMSRFESVDIPTNFDYVIYGCIYGYYNSTHDPKIPLLYSKTIIDLLQSDPVHVWCAYNICFFQVCNESKKQSPFYIMSPDFIKQIKDLLVFKRSELEKCNEWLGSDVNNGLWGDIEASNNVLFEDFGVNLI